MSVWATGQLGKKKPDKTTINLLTDNNVGAEDTEEADNKEVLDAVLVCSLQNTCLIQKTKCT